MGPVAERRQRAPRAVGSFGTASARCGGRRGLPARAGRCGPGPAARAACPDPLAGAGGHAAPCGGAERCRLEPVKKL